MKAALLIVNMLAIGSTVASPILKRNCGVVHDAIPTATEAEHLEENMKRMPADADENIGNMWGVATGKHEEDLGVIKTDE
ncbi:hypothetical protein EV127DRAFT_486945 [Xylaria flabelliformis]|nr:hypothetical protein EV127DRAFT_486945 [Xylaria flabelliformis]